MPLKHRACAVVAVMVTLLSAGCEVVLFEHPLSDEKTSKPDERLIGDWTPFQEEAPMPGFDQTEDVTRVTRPAGAKNVLRVCAVDEPKRKSICFYTTEIQGQHYVSVKATDVVEAEEPRGWLICRYEFTDPETVRFYSADAKFLARAIESGQLDGKAAVRKETTTTASTSSVFEVWLMFLIRPWLDASGTRPGSQEARAHKSYVVTASPEELAAFLAEHGLECFPKYNELLAFVASGRSNGKEGP